MMSGMKFVLISLLLVQATFFPSSCDGAIGNANESPDGYASMNGGTSGGRGGKVKYVSNEAQLRSALSNDEPCIVKITENIKLNSRILVGSNKSILGANTRAGIWNSGLYVAGKRNVIIRGLKITYPLFSLGSNSIDIDNSKNIWIDHNEFFSKLNVPTDHYKMFVSGKFQADFITVTWNKFHDHDKVMLFGADDSNTSDKGHLRVTLHHNHFYSVTQRLPNIRFGTAHIYNNLYESVTLGTISSRMGAQVLVQNNVFTNARWSIVTNEGSKQNGFAVENGNAFTNSAPKISNVGTFTKAPYNPNSMEKANTAASKVKAGAGATLQFP